MPNRSKASRSNQVRPGQTSTTEAMIGAIVLDGGYADEQSYDRTLDGPYLKLSIGFGG